MWIKNGSSDVPAATPGILQGADMSRHVDTYSLLAAIADEQRLDSSLNFMGLRIRTLAVSDRNATKQIMWKPVSFFCAFYRVPAIVSSEMLALLLSAKDRLSCQINHMLAMKVNVSCSIQNIFYNVIWAISNICAMQKILYKNKIALG